VSGAFVCGFLVAIGSQPEPARIDQPGGAGGGAATGLSSPKTVSRQPAGNAGAENAAMADEITPELTAAVDRGLAALASMQNDDGSFGSGRFAKNVAVTSLACLALMGDGNVPGRGKYGAHVERGLRYVLGCCSETGLIAGDSINGPMYGHGFATLFLGEVYGMTAGGGDTALADRVHDALVRACRLIERTQNDEGGWRYNPVPFDADVSVTICQIMGLRSARNAGLEVPKSTIDRAVAYVRECQMPDGGFKYQKDSGVSAWPRSAAGVASLYYAGIYDDAATRRGVTYLTRAATPGSAMRTEAHYFYGMYYTAQSMYLSGGKAWEEWWPVARAELLTRQAGGGEWNDSGVGSAYGTSMALIVLQMPKRYLPIFQK
jgi:hypothetical protein